VTLGGGGNTFALECNRSSLLFVCLFVFILALFDSTFPLHLFGWFGIYFRRLANLVSSALRSMELTIPEFPNKLKGMDASSSRLPASIAGSFEFPTNVTVINGIVFPSNIKERLSSKICQPHNPASKMEGYTVMRRYHVP
jgi:hypothetical protein